MSLRPMLWPTVFAIPALVVLILLGNWQMDRLDWKQDLLMQIEQGMAAEPIGLPPVESWISVDPSIQRYSSVSATGVFDHANEAHIYISSIDGKPGYHVITPLELTGGGWLLVDRGFVPIARKAADTRPSGQLDGEVTVQGVLVVPDEANAFTPEPDFVKNVWYHRPIDILATQAGVSPVFPMLMDAGPLSNPGGLPVGGQTHLELKNPHLGYALTWYGLAATLIGVWLAFLLTRRRAETGA